MTSTSASHNGNGIKSEVNELVSLVVAYAKQETVVPLKSLVRYIAAGVAGSLLLATGGAILTLAAVRAVQSETGRHLHGNLTWVPYLAGILLASLGAAWALQRILKKVK